MVDTKFRIFNEKCQLLLQIQRLDKEALARQIYEQAEEHDWPGLGRDVRAICEEIQIPDINKYSIDKKEIRSLIYEGHYKGMIKMFDQSKKLQDIKNDDFRTFQNYFHDKNLYNARLKFKIRAKMVENVPGNFKNCYKYNETGLNCHNCLVELSQNHLSVCPAREKFRDGLDMSKLDDMVIYVRRYLTDIKKPILTQE
jgi:hypothetical protein